MTTTKKTKKINSKKGDNHFNIGAIPLGAHLVAAGYDNHGTTGRHGGPTKYELENKINPY